MAKGIKNFTRKLRKDGSVIFKGSAYAPESANLFKDSDIDFSGVELHFCYFENNGGGYDLSRIYYQPTHTERKLLGLADSVLPIFI